MSEAIETTGEEVEADPGVALERAEREGLLPSVPTRESISHRDAIQLGHVLAASGYFKDAEGAAGAAVKVMAGTELGFAPIASIMGVHIVEGRPMLSGRLLGAVVKRDPDYDYRIAELECDRDPNGMPKAGRCEVVMTFQGEDLTPSSVFTIDDARMAGLVKERGNWHKYPAKMLFWRALSWAVDFHCPHLLGGMPLLAVEDQDDEAPSLVRELNPPAERPPALADAKAEDLRAKARAAYDRLKAANPTLVPPGKFRNAIANAEHSHERLEAEVEAFTSLADVEEAIAEATAALIAKLGEAKADPTLVEAARKPSRAEYRDHLLGALSALDEDGGDDA